MPTKADHTSVTPIPTHSRNTLPHLDNDSVFKLTELKVSKSLEHVKGPMDDVPEDARIVNIKSKEIPRPFLVYYCVEPKARLHIVNAIKYSYDFYLYPCLYSIRVEPYLRVCTIFCVLPNLESAIISETLR